MNDKEPSGVRESVWPPRTAPPPPGTSVIVPLSPSNQHASLVRRAENGTDGGELPGDCNKSRRDVASDLSLSAQRRRRGMLVERCSGRAVQRVPVDWGGVKVSDGRNFTTAVERAGNQIKCL